MQVMPLTILPIMIFGGLFVNLSTIPGWLSWVQYISPIRYSYNGMMVEDFGQVGLPALSVCLSVHPTLIHAYRLSLIRSCLHHSLIVYCPCGELDSYTDSHVALMPDLSPAGTVVIQGKAASYAMPTTHHIAIARLTACMAAAWLLHDMAPVHGGSSSPPSLSQISALSCTTLQQKPDGSCPYDSGADYLKIASLDLTVSECLWILLLMYGILRVWAYMMLVQITRKTKA